MRSTVGTGEQFDPWRFAHCLDQLGNNGWDTSFGFARVVISTYPSRVWPSPGRQKNCLALIRCLVSLCRAKIDFDATPIVSRKSAFRSDITASASLHAKIG